MIDITAGVKTFALARNHAGSPDRHMQSSGAVYSNSGLTRGYSPLLQDAPEIL
jgi:hypothetical protein